MMMDYKIRKGIFRDNLDLELMASEVHTFEGSDYMQLVMEAYAKAEFDFAYDTNGALRPYKVEARIGVGGVVVVKILIFESLQKRKAYETRRFILNN